MGLFQILLDERGGAHGLLPSCSLICLSTNLCCSASPTQSALPSISFIICCRLSVNHLTAEGEVCDCEVADGGVGMDGSVKRIRAYKRKVNEPLKHNENS